MALNLDRARMTVSGTPGTGTITLLAAALGYDTFANAGAVNGSVYSYLAEDGALWEYGTGTYSSTGPTLTRTVIRSSAGTTAVSLTSNAIISITFLAEDINAKAASGANTDITSLTANSVTPTGGSLTVTGAFSCTSTATLQPQNFIENKTADANAGYIVYQKQRAGAVVQVNDTLGTFIFQAWNGSAYVNAAYLTCMVDTAGASPVASYSFTAGASQTFVVKSTLAQVNQPMFFNGGYVAFLGPTSGSTVIQPTAIASGTLTLPAATDTLVGKATTDAFTNKTITLTAGSTTVAPVVYTSGTNLTTPVAGAIEYDGTVHYSTHAASERGVALSEQIQILSTTYILTSTTAVQKLLNASTNGAITLAVGTYEFECMFSLSSMSATSGSFGFALGGTATKTQAWKASANKAALATATSMTDTFNTAANTALTAANTTTTGYAWIVGTIRVTVTGTVIPQVSLGVAAAAVVGDKSFFKIWPIGSSTVTTVGNWS